MLRSSLATFLLLCLLRTLLPEAWVVAWHSHQHTTAEPAHFGAPHARHRLPLLTPKHQHCHAEQFYNVPFVAAAPVRLPQPHQQPRYCQLPPRFAPGSRVAAGREILLRGPPAQPSWRYGGVS